MRQRRSGAGRWAGALLVLCGSSVAQAQAVAPAADAPAIEGIEGAVGLLMSYGPAFGGSSDYGISVRPAGFLRWGRFTLTGAGGFTTKRNDEVDRGLGAELLRRDDLRLSFGLGYDQGRRESESADLAGMGDIPRAVRARVIVRWDPVPDWRLSAALGADTRDRFGGWVLDLGVTREWRLAPGQSWKLSASISGAGERHMQTWYGVTPEQSAQSGYAAYAPGIGLRDLNLAGIWRVEFAQRWAGYLGASATRLLGPAEKSPITRRTDGYALHSGLAWRF